MRRYLASLVVMFLPALVSAGGVSPPPVLWGGQSVTGIDCGINCTLNSGTLKLPTFTFTGAGVSTSTVGSDVTVTIPGGGGGAGTPAVYASHWHESNQTTLTGNMKALSFTTVRADTDAAVSHDATGWKFTCPADKGGLYYVRAAATLTTNVSNAFLVVTKNETQVARGNRIQTTTTYNGLEVTAAVSLAPGDSLRIYIYTASSGTVEGTTVASASASAGVMVASMSAATMPQTPTWTTPTFQNSWTQHSDPAINPITAGYWKDPNTGYVHLRGIITGGANNTVAFTLPVGLRPATTRSFNVGMYNAGMTTGRALVRSNGTVAILFTTATNYASLDGISFPAEQ